MTANVFALLDEIRRRPEMYVGGDEDDRGAQLESIETLLYGYSLAVELHALDDPGRGIVESFSDDLDKRFGWSTALGPIVAILEGTPSGQDAWEQFWMLISDFQQHLGSEGS